LLLTIPEAQALTGLSKDVLRDAISDGTLKAKTLKGSIFRNFTVFDYFL